MVLRNSVFIKPPSLSDCIPRLRNNPPAHQRKIISCNASNWYLKEARSKQNRKASGSLSKQTFSSGLLMRQFI